jgi:hypothetical protein
MDLVIPDLPGILTTGLKKLRNRTKFYGSADELLFAGMGRRLAQRLPHADFQLYEGEGHYCIFKHWFEILSTFSLGQV